MGVLFYVWWSEEFLSEKVTFVEQVEGSTEAGHAHMAGVGGWVE